MNMAQIDEEKAAIMAQEQHLLLARQEKIMREQSAIDFYKRVGFTCTLYSLLPRPA